MNLFLNFLTETWWLTAEMAPYLLLGFIIAGLLRTFFTEAWVRRHLGQKGLRQIIKSVVIGIPLPLCSCGVIPVAAGIRRQGGQRGAVAAFTAATPQTGVDAIAATVGMLGWVFAAVRVLIAFFNGIVAGLVVERWGEKDAKASASQPTETACCASDTAPCCCEGGGGDQPRVDAESCCEGGSGVEKESNSCCGPEPDGVEAQPAGRLSAFRSGLRFGLLTLPADLFAALCIGLLLAGAIGAFVPTGFFNSIPGGQFGVYLGMTLLSLPLYVCSTGSIPMAFSFLGAGVSPGAVLIFLIAGPATNTATVTSLWTLLGPRATLGYIISIVLTSWLFAALMDFSGLSLAVTEAIHDHEMGISPFQHLAAGALVAVLLIAKGLPLIRRGT